MKHSPYQQYLSRNAVELMSMMQSFHELNHYYSGLFLLSCTSTDWELYDTRVSRCIVTFPFKKFNDMRLYMNNLLHDMVNISLMNSIYNGTRKLKRSELYSCRRILNLYGFDEYFIDNHKLINYIVYAELERNKK